MKQTEISKELGISQSAVSQCHTSSRAPDETLYSIFPKINDYAKEVALKIVKGKLKSDEILLCVPCQIVRKNKKFSNFHDNFIQLQKCKICR